MFRFWNLLANTPRLLQMVWKASPIWLSLTMVITLAQALIPVAQLYVGKLVVDTVVSTLAKTNPNLLPLAGLLGLELGLTLLNKILDQANIYASLVLSDQFTLYANKLLLEQAIQLDINHYESPEFYDILNRAQQNGSKYPVRVLSILTTLIGQIVSIIGLFILLLRFSLLVMVLLLLTSIPVLWVGVRFSKRRFWMLRHQTQSGRLADYFQRVLTEQAFVKEVRLFNLGNYLLNQWREIRTRFNQESAALAYKQTSAQFKISILENLGFYFAYGLVIWQALHKKITLGDLTMYVGVFQQSQKTLQGILLNIASIYEYNLYVSQYFEFLSLKPQVINLPNLKPFPVPIRSGLVIHDVSFTYPGSNEPCLQDLNLVVKAGECIALVGENGSGKTTFLKLLARFYDIDKGEIMIDNIRLDEFDLSELRRNISVLFQDFAHYALSVEDNIGFGDIQDHNNLSRVEQAAIDSGAAKVIASLEQGYQTILGKIFANGVELSGGQWQKIGLARAFMTSAQILILDEPTAAMDAIAEYDLFQRFRQLTYGKMTFLVSHRFSTVRMADRIVVLDKGRIVEVGSHAELMANCGLYAKMFNLQAMSYQIN